MSASGRDLPLGIGGEGPLDPDEGRAASARGGLPLRRPARDRRKIAIYRTPPDGFHPEVEPADGRARILVDVGHPAHVHFFRNAIRILRESGHDVLVTANDKDVTLELLRGYGIPFVRRGAYHRSAAGKLLMLPRTTLAMAREAKRFRADVLTGINNPYVAEASRLLSKVSVVFDDTEWARGINLTTFPFATLVCTPRNFRLDLGPRHVRYDGFHELAYVHPRYFQPDPKVAARLSEGGRPYAIVRLIGWTASHDPRMRESPLVASLREGGLARLGRSAKVWIVSERDLPGDLAPARYPLPAGTVLDALAGSVGYLGEGATMATEAALLGKPAVFVSEKRFGSMDDIEQRFGLLRTLASAEEAVARFDELLRSPATQEAWAARRERFLRDNIDVTAFLCKLLADPSLVARLSTGGDPSPIARAAAASRPGEVPRS